VAADAVTGCCGEGVGVTERDAAAEGDEPLGRGTDDWVVADVTVGDVTAGVVTVGVNAVV
jgi:hypothetical protein